MAENLQEVVDRKRLARKSPIYMFNIGSVKLVTSNRDFIDQYKVHIQYPFVNVQTFDKYKRLVLPSSDGVCFEYIDSQNWTEEELTDDKSIFNLVLLDGDKSKYEDFELAMKFVSESLIDNNGQVSLSMDKRRMNKDFEITSYKNGEVAKKVTDKDFDTFGRTVNKSEVRGIIDTMTADFDFAESENEM